jgi:hypothetical protein
MHVRGTQPATLAPFAADPGAVPKPAKAAEAKALSPEEAFDALPRLAAELKRARRRQGPGGERARLRREFEQAKATIERAYGPIDAGLSDSGSDHDDPEAARTRPAARPNTVPPPARRQALAGWSLGVEQQLRMALTVDLEGKLRQVGTDDPLRGEVIDEMLDTANGLLGLLQAGRKWLNEADEPPDDMGQLFESMDRAEARCKAFLQAHGGSAREASRPGKLEAALVADLQGEFEGLPAGPGYESAFHALLSRARASLVLLQREEARLLAGNHLPAGVQIERLRQVGLAIGRHRDFIAVYSEA